MKRKKIAMAGVDMDCGLCGGRHYGTAKCPFLAEQICALCGETIRLGESRHFGNPESPLYGKIFHVRCAPEETYLSQVMGHIPVS